MNYLTNKLYKATIKNLPNDTRKFALIVIDNKIILLMNGRVLYICNNNKNDLTTILQEYDL